MDQPFLGMIVLLPYTFTVERWALCDGRLLSIAQNAALFALLGNQFGGDGRTTFALPNLPGPSSGLRYQIALSGIFPLRADS